MPPREWEAPDPDEWDEPTEPDPDQAYENWRDNQ